MAGRIRNLGPVSMGWLAAIDVQTLEELRDLGSVNAYRLLTLRGYNVSLNLLWAMEAALRDVHWMEIDAATKSQLRARLAEPWDPSELLGLGWCPHPARAARSRSRPSPPSPGYGSGEGIPDHSSSPQLSRGEGRPTYCTITLSVAPRPKVSGEYISSARGGGTM